MINLRDVLDGPFAKWLAPGGDWTAWRAFLAALRGEQMSAEEFAIFTKHTGRTTAPNEPFAEAWVVAGRRARKSAVAAVLGTHFALYGEWPKAAGGTVSVLIVAVSREQAREIRGYCEGILESNPELKNEIVAADAFSITLKNGVTIQVVANNYRSVRGRTICCAIFDEVAFWRDERSLNPDVELYRAVTPSMLTMPGALLIGISSPYARRGLLYEKHKQHHGVDDSKVLVWQASTEEMNPDVNGEFIAQAYLDDPVAASAEYGGLFRTDVEAYASLETIEAVTDLGVGERAPLSGICYVAFVDPSGGSSDSMTLGISHKEKEITLLDCVREVKAPFDPSVVVEDFAKVLKSYRITKVSGDRYAGEWPAEAFKKRGVTYEPAEKTKGELYLALLPLLNSGRVRLLDNERLARQLVGLERRTARSGRETVDHGPQRNVHDDLANAAAGALVGAKKSGYDINGFFRKEDGTLETAEESDASWRQMNRNLFLLSGGRRY